MLVKKPRVPRNKKQSPAAQKPPLIRLFDLGKDMGERTNRAGEYPEIVKRLRTRMEELDAEITTNARTPWIKD